MPKDKIRKEMLERLRKQDESIKIEKSLAIKHKLFRTEQFKKSIAVMFYVSKYYEVNTHDMIDEAILMGKRVMVPKTIKHKPMLTIYEISSREELLPGNMGILEPKEETLRVASHEAIDLVVVPGIAFDKRGNRIGHGKGYYDNFLKSLRDKTHIIGLAFDFQIVDEIPSHPHDFPVEKIISA